MIELWTKEQINEALTNESALDLIEVLLQHQSLGVDYPPTWLGLWEILDVEIIPTESVTVVLKGPRLNIRVHSDAGGRLTKTQVFPKEEVVTITHYVTVKEL